MKKFKYLLKDFLKFIIKILFYIMKKLPFKKNRVVLDSWKGQELRGNLLCIYNQLLLLHDYEIVVVDNNRKQKTKNGLYVKSKSLLHMYYLATSGYWIVDTLYYDFFRPRKETKYILIWHAPGIFKKFGISTVNYSKRLMDIYNTNGRNISYLVISSENEEIKKVYAKELCVNPKRILGIGLPRTDEFINCNQIVKNKIYNKYKLSMEKKLILYAPTFRNEGYSEFEINLKPNLIINNLKEKYVILLKLHPNNYIDKSKLLKEYKGRLILSEEDKLEDLMKSSDLLITDYSSILFEYSLLKKPILFYAYDLKAYIKNSRGFYVDYKTFVPGPICYSTEEILFEIENYCTDKYMRKIEKLEKYYLKNDGKSTERFIEYFFTSKK